MMGYRGSFIDVAENLKNNANRSKSHLNSLHENILPAMRTFNLWKTFDIKNGNIFTHAAYQIKKSELEITYGRHACRTEILLHATSAHNITSILKNNLDWRYVRRSKYGTGVSFSHDAYYANKYCTNRNGAERVFIVCEILMGKVQKVSDNTDSYPKNGTHTYKTYNDKVVVKFDDFTFYPIFIVYYSTGPSSFNSLSMLENLEIIIEPSNTDFKIEKKLISQIAQYIGIDSFPLVMIFLVVYIVLLLMSNTLLIITVLSFTNIFVLFLFEKVVSLKHWFTGEIVPIFFNEYRVDMFEKIWKFLISSGLHKYRYYNSVVMVYFLVVLQFPHTLVVLRLSAVCMGRKRRNAYCK